MYVLLYACASLVGLATICMFLMILLKDDYGRTVDKSELHNDDDD